MEFMEFIDRQEIEIIRLVEQAGYKTVENTTLCLLSNKYVGFLKKKEKTIVICTDNAKKRENYINIRNSQNDVFERTGLHIKKALRHEATHVAQECNNGRLLNIKKNLTMNPAKIEALKGSIKISRDEKKERQAYILEDKPKLLKKQLKKYCL